MISTQIGKLFKRGRKKGRSRGKKEEKEGKGRKRGENEEKEGKGKKKRKKGRKKRKRRYDGQKKMILGSFSNRAGEDFKIDGTIYSIHLERKLAFVRYDFFFYY